MKNKGLNNRIYKCIAPFITLIAAPSIFSQPNISSFFPISGQVGTLVTINGANFSPVLANNIVYFGAVRATVTTSTATILTVTVPSGATYNPISVTTGGLTGYSSLPFVVTSPGGGKEFQQGSFSSRINFSAGSNPTTIFTSDVDGDGKPDMVSVNTSSNTLSVYRNTSTLGTISFSTKVDLTTGANPQMVAMADIDGDGKPDAVVPNYTSGTISVYRNISTPGTISLAAKVDFAVSQGPVDAVIGDIDNDGKPDVVVTNNTSNSVSLLKNTSLNSTILFATKIDMATGNNPQNAILSDIDGDRKTEIAVIDGTSNVSVYKNTSNINAISFSSKVDFFCGNVPNYIAAGDLDSDGKPELVIASNSSVTVLRNTSTVASLSFIRRDFSNNNTNFIVSISDIDGDSKPDLAVTSYISGIAALLRNTSTTGFITFETAVNFSTASNPFGNALCDFDGDGLSDLAVANYNTNSISVRKNTTTNANSPNIAGFSPTSAGTGTEVTITGTNLTGATSVSFGGVPASFFTIISSTTIKALVSNGASGSVQITTPNGNAALGGFIYVLLPIIHSFTPVTAGTGFKITISGSNFEGASNVKFGGVNALSFTILSANTIEAVVANGASGNVEVTTNGGTVAASGFTYIPAPIVNSFSPANGSPGSTVTISGNNFDSTTAVFFGEIPATSFTIISPNTIQAVPGTSGGSLKVISPYGESSKDGFYNGITISSFDPQQGPVDTTVIIYGSGFSNNKEENVVFFGAVRGKVLTASPTQLNIQVPAGSNYSPISVTTSNTTAFTTVPFNVTFPTTDTVKATSLGKKVDFRTGGVTNPYDVAFGDLDGDGRSEVIVANSSSNTVSIFRNGSVPGLIVLLPKVDLNTQGQPTKVNILDLNGDAKPEIVVHYYSNDFTIYKNLSSPGSLSFSPMTIDTLGGRSYHRVTVADFDGDGKPDLTGAHDETHQVAVVRNTSNTAEISFSNPVYFGGARQPQSVVAADFDLDGKIDMAVSNFNFNGISIYKNVSVPGFIQFESPTSLNIGNGLGTLISADFDNDGKADLAVVNQGYDNVSVLKNISTSGFVNFAPALDFATGDNPYNLITSDINGDGKTDLILVNILSGTLSMYQNYSTEGVMNFSTKVDIETGTEPIAIGSCDLDGDGKTDVAVANFRDNSISIFRNQVGEIPKLQLCPNGQGTLNTNKMGTIYQWQVNSGNGYVNIGENSNYIGSSTSTLVLTNIPSSFYGYQYRCVVDGVKDEVTVLQFVNTWTGANNDVWNNSANWSCGAVPDGNTDVFIKSGAVVVSSNAICRSLTLTPGVNFSVNPGVTFTITH